MFKSESYSQDFVNPRLILPQIVPSVPWDIAIIVNIVNIIHIVNIVNRVIIVNSLVKIVVKIFVKIVVKIFDNIVIIV